MVGQKVEELGFLAESKGYLNKEVKLPMTRMEGEPDQETRDRRKALK